MTIGVECIPLSGGRNSHVCLSQRAGEPVVIKTFQGFDVADRFKRELASFQFLTSLPIQWTADILEYDEQAYRITMQYLSGVPVTTLPETSLNKVRVSVLKFWQMIFETRVSQQVPEAKDNAIDWQIFCQDLWARWRALQALNDDRLTEILEPIAPVINRLSEKATLQNELPIEAQCWIPADFSLQNTLWQADKQKLWVVDFEFAGRDDPARLLADWVWHPAHSSMLEQQWQLEAWVLRHWQDSPEFIERYEFLKRACGVRWVLILLNMFLPSYSKHRSWFKVLSEKEKYKMQWQQRHKAILLWQRLTAIL